MWKLFATELRCDIIEPWLWVSLFWWRDLTNLGIAPKFVIFVMSCNAGLPLTIRVPISSRMTIRVFCCYLNPASVPRRRSTKIPQQPDKSYVPYATEADIRCSPLPIKASFHLHQLSETAQFRFWIWQDSETVVRSIHSSRPVRFQGQKILTTGPVGSSSTNAGRSQKHEKGMIFREPINRMINASSGTTSTSSISRTKVRDLILDLLRNKSPSLRTRPSRIDSLCPINCVLCYRREIIDEVLTGLYEDLISWLVDAWAFGYWEGNAGDAGVLGGFAVIYQPFDFHVGRADFERVSCLR